MTPERTVYFNVPQLLLAASPPCEQLRQQSDQQPSHGHKSHLEELSIPWSDSVDLPGTADDPPLECLKEVKIRFFFYYSSEVGVGAHANDFESIQINVRVERNEPTQKVDDIDRWKCGVPANLARHCATVAGAFGSAHGIAWYTNGLNIGRNKDTLIPVTVLAEEGKHASSPDRNGDGTYTPGFDVDVHPNDAWGVRDILRTRWLQGPGFRAEMSKTRVPVDRVFPPLFSLSDNQSNDVKNPRLVALWSRNARSKVKLDGVDPLTYVLEPIRQAMADDGLGKDPYCDTQSDDMNDHFKKGHKDSQGLNYYELGCAKGLPCEHLADLLSGEEGCRQTRVLTDRGWTKYRRTLAALNIGGTHDEYLTWSRFFRERLMPGIRISGSAHTIWWIPPVAWNVPGLDGWVTARWQFFPEGGWFVPESAQHVREGAIDVLYSVSAARYVSPYIALGRDTVPSDTGSTGSEVTQRHAVALEGGIKWRFAIPGIGLFSGFRIGVRASDPSNLGFFRLIVEAGGGSW
jgi:hypothetical protein